MSTATDTLTIEFAIACEKDQAEKRRLRSARFQFWYCTAMSCVLLAVGAWLLDAARGPASICSAIMGNAAATVWLCVPTCIIFAWMGYRKMKTAGLAAN